MMGRRAQLSRLDDGITAIDTEYARPLHDASHLIVADGRAAFVDTGNNNSVPLLLDALEQHQLSVAAVDFVFLTHIHLDHAGGAGQLMQALPNARCVVHPRGAPHMVDPTALIAGTEAVYGVQRMQELYGDIVPIDAERILIPEDGEWLTLNGRAMQALFTEGHARHHYCLFDPQSRGVFTGDSFGVSYRELDTAAGEFVFPTTTPASFDPPEAHKAIDRIMACEPEQLYLTHYSRVENPARLAADMHAGLDAYVALATQHASDVNRATTLTAAIFDYLAERLVAHGFKGDRDAMWSVIGPDVTLNTQGLEVWLDRQTR